MSSKSYTTQQDQRIVVDAGGVGLAAGSEYTNSFSKDVAEVLKTGLNNTKSAIDSTASILSDIGKANMDILKSGLSNNQSSLNTLASSLTAGNKTASDILNNVLSATKDITLSAFEKSQTLTKEALTLAGNTNTALSEKLQETELGSTAVFPQVAKYILIAVAVVFGLKAVFK